MNGTSVQFSGESNFLSATRSDASEIKRSNDGIRSQPILVGTIEGVQDIMMIMDANRQVVYANRNLYGALGMSKDFNVNGKRLGELLHCVNSNCPGGCGTSLACRSCGAAAAIWECQREKRKVAGECSINRKGVPESLNLNVVAAPIDISLDAYTILSLSLISDTKMRDTLERVFLHDITNLAGCLKGFSGLLKNESLSRESISILADVIFNASSTLIDEIGSHRKLLFAELSGMKADFSKLCSLDIVKNVSSFFKTHDVSAGKGLAMRSDSVDVGFHSDRAILVRILGNMLKNALEATPEGGQVSIGCYPSYGCWAVEFRVFNPGVIARDIQNRIFQSSFSTKGRGRGLGAYSMKLLGEKCLGGSVSFISNDEAGTVFSLFLPA